MQDSEPIRFRTVPIDRFLRPLQEFIHRQASSGIVLLFSAVIALIWANSGWAHVYNDFWHTEMSFHVGGAAISKNLLHWVNDGLMAVFFLLVGLEIKREFLVGELSNIKQALLPIFCAIGGMVVPALVYTIFNFDSPGAKGWGIPMATDIAFALGILALLGSRVPLALKAFLVAIAIVDDIGAVIVIAGFYTSDISVSSLLVALVIMVLLVSMNRLHLHHQLPYLVAGFFLWIAFLSSGLHATLAGVLLALTIPARSRINVAEFLVVGRELLDEYEGVGDLGNKVPVRQERQMALQELEKQLTHVWMPLQRLEHTLHPWVAFGVMPLFAFANSGVAITGDLGAAVSNPVSLGIIAGLIFGKQVGIMLTAWLTVKFGWSTLPYGVTWPQIYGIAWLGGIGFTMSIFVSTAAFGAGDLLQVSKIGVLIASVISGLVGYVLVNRYTKNAD
jgi:NhaA family Na+:H+ antiporter